ncbi:MAG: hypothetical protein JNL32_08445 [Candidatus Kapabacteria bacterium]|nr:hypothetical protein [Candidatus Kapabacteria bacterium]
MTDNFSPSDIIYLYLDGEADSVQQATLFAALATDADLQQEFNEALEMRKTFENERMTAEAPAYLTASVMSSAGITETIGGLAATTAALWLALRKLAVPAGTLGIGAIMMYFGMTFLQDDSQQSITALKQQPAIEQVQPQTTPSLQPPSAPPEYGQLSDAIPPTPFASRIIQQQRRHTSITTNGNNLTTSQESLRDDESAYLSEESANEGVLTESARISMVSPYSGIGGRRTMPMVNVPTVPFSLRADGDYSLEINRLGITQFFGVAPQQTPYGLFDFDNVNLAFLVTHNEYFSYGGQIGRNTFALSAVDNAAGTLQNEVYTSVSGVVMLRDPSTSVIGGQPFVRFTLGSTFDGKPIGTLFSGLTFPVSIARISAGLDASGLLYSSRGQTQLSNTFGFSIGCSVGF